jgi:hypothetical protein
MVAVMTTSWVEKFCKTITISSHSEPIGRMVAARKLSMKSSGRLGLGKREGRISMGKRVFEKNRSGKSGFFISCRTLYL